MEEGPNFSLRYDRIVCPLHPTTPLHICNCLHSLSICDFIGSDAQVSTLCKDIRQRCEKLPRFLEFTDLCGRQLKTDRTALNPWIRQDLIQKMKTEESTPLINWINKYEMEPYDLEQILTRNDISTFNLLVEDVLNIIPVLISAQKVFVSVVVGRHPHFPDSRCFRLHVSRNGTPLIHQTKTSESRRDEYLFNFRQLAKGKVDKKSDTFRPLPLCDPIDFMSHVSSEAQNHHIISMCGLLQAHATALGNYVEATTIGTNPQLTFGIQEPLQNTAAGLFLSGATRQFDIDSHSQNSSSDKATSSFAHPVYLSSNESDDSQSSSKPTIPDFVRLPNTIKNVVCPYTRCDLPDLSDLINVLRRSITMMILPSTPESAYIQQTHHSVSDTTSRSKSALDHASDYFVVTMNRILVLVSNIICNLFIRYIESKQLSSTQYYKIMDAFRIVSPQIYNGWVPLQIHLMQSSNINILPTFTALTAAASLQANNEIAEEEIKLERKELEADIEFGHKELAIKKIIASKPAASSKRK